jgi:hypothetical protein
MTRALSGKCSRARGLRRIRNQGQGVQHAAYRDSAEQILNVRHALHHESPLIAHTSIKTINSQLKNNRSASSSDSEQLYFHLDISYSVITKSCPSGLRRLGERHKHFSAVPLGSDIYLKMTVLEDVFLFLSRSFDHEVAMLPCR